jgi:hypothetical protein
MPESEPVTTAVRGRKLLGSLMPAQIPGDAHRKRPPRDATTSGQDAGVASERCRSRQRRT